MIVYDFVHAYVAVFVLLVNVWCESLCLYVCLVASMYMWLLVCRLYVFNGMPVCVSVCVGVIICLIIMCVESSFQGIPRRTLGCSLPRPRVFEDSRENTAHLDFVWNIDQNINMDNYGMITCLYCFVKIKPGRASTHLLKCPAYRPTLLHLQRQVDSQTDKGFKYGKGFFVRSKSSEK